LITSGIAALPDLIDWPHTSKRFPLARGFVKLELYIQNNTTGDPDGISGLLLREACGARRMFPNVYLAYAAGKQTFSVDALTKDDSKVLGVIFSVSDGC
jgi:hypothetical protein